MSGRPKADLVLSEAEREQLTALTMRRKTGQALALRARIVLTCAEGIDNKTVAAKLRVTQQTVSKWRGRYVMHRLDGLLDAPRPGTPRSMTHGSMPLSRRRWRGSAGIREYVKRLLFATPGRPSTRTKARSAQTNGIVERLHKTMLNEFYRIAFRKKIYDSIATLQTDLDAWHDQYSNEREHQGRWCYGKTPMRTFLDSLELAKEKLIPHR